jgi:hypothetical protein
MTAEYLTLAIPMANTRPAREAGDQPIPTIVELAAPHWTQACKIVGASSDAELLQRCEAKMQERVGREATAVRSQTHYL